MNKNYIWQLWDKFNWTLHFLRRILISILFLFSVNGNYIMSEAELFFCKSYADSIYFSYATFRMLLLLLLLLTTHPHYNYWSITVICWLLYSLPMYKWYKKLADCVTMSFVFVWYWEILKKQSSAEYFVLYWYRLCKRLHVLKHNFQMRAVWPTHVIFSSLRCFGILLKYIHLAIL